jgi:hypothetical protein
LPGVPVEAFDAGSGTDELSLSSDECVVRVGRRSSGLAVSLQYKEGTLDEVDGLQLLHRLHEAIEAIAEDKLAEDGTAMAALG